jgi:Cu+-exporting ATPase
MWCRWQGSTRKTFCTSSTPVKGDQSGIAEAICLSRATMRHIPQSLFFEFVYNALGIPVAAGLLYPYFGLLHSPSHGAAMSLSSVPVIRNTLRLFGKPTQSY